MSHYRRCPHCETGSILTRSGATRCPACLKAASASGDHRRHRLDVVRGKVGGVALAQVLVGLESEGFTVAPPGTALVPADWLIRLKAILRPEDIGLDTPLPFTAGGFKALADHIDSLPAVQAITTGELP